MGIFKSAWNAGNEWSLSAHCFYMILTDGPGQLRTYQVACFQIFCAGSRITRTTTWSVHGLKNPLLSQNRKKTWWNARTTNRSKFWNTQLSLDIAVCSMHRLAAKERSGILHHNYGTASSIKSKNAEAFRHAPLQGQAPGPLRNHERKDGTGSLLNIVMRLSLEQIWVMCL